MTQSSLNRAIGDLAAALRARRPVRAGSLIVTFFGDTILPRGGSVATQSLLNTMELFGLGQGVVRTALSRLCAEDMFARTRSGRNSFYHLTEKARGEYSEASDIIYADPPPEKWDGSWISVLLTERAEHDEGALRKALTGLGLAKFGPLIHMRPANLSRAARYKLECLLDDQPALVIEGEGGPIPPGFKAAVDGVWDLERISRGYDQFVRRYQPIALGLARDGGLDARQSMMLRLLVIHDYRQLALKDPMLPLEILPMSWQGELAREICRRIYLAVHAASENWVADHCRGQHGPLPPPGAPMANRYGGVLV